MLANMPYNAFKCTYNSHFLLPKFHVINLYNHWIYWIWSECQWLLYWQWHWVRSSCHVIHVTVIESHIYTPYYHKLTEQQFGAAQYLAATGLYCLKCHKLPIIFSNKLPVILKYCSLLLDTYNARKNASNIYLGLMQSALDSSLDVTSLCKFE